MSRALAPGCSRQLDVDRFLSVVGVSSDQIESTPDLREREDVHPEGRAACDRFEDAGLDPRPDRRLRQPENLSDLGHLGPSVPIGQVIAHGVQRSTPLQTVLVLRQLLRAKESSTTSTSEMRRAYTQPSEMGLYPK